jgi:hypothetical protein
MTIVVYIYRLNCIGLPLQQMYGAVQKSVNLKHSLVLTRMFRFKPANTGMSQLYMLFLIQLLLFHAESCTSNIVS